MSCDGLWRHCARKCDLTCDHNEWCPDCEAKYNPPPTIRQRLKRALRRFL